MCQAITKCFGELQFQFFHHKISSSSSTSSSSHSCVCVWNEVINVRDLFDVPHLGLKTGCHDCGHSEVRNTFQTLHFSQFLDAIRCVLCAHFYLHLIKIFKWKFKWNEVTSVDTFTTLCYCVLCALVCSREINPHARTHKCTKK